MPDYHRILITGAAGSLGSHLRHGLAHLADRLRLVDVRDMGAAAAHEEIVVCDLADKAAALEVTRDCDAIVHFAGHPREQTLRGDRRRHAARPPTTSTRAPGGTARSASSTPARSTRSASTRSRTVPDTRVMHRPDTFYGLTKTFVEDLASLYWDKFGLESVCLRICSCFEEPRDRRMLWSWLSFADCVRLAEAALTAPRVGFSVIYGTSDNAAAAVSNAHAAPHRLPPAGQRRRLRRGGAARAPSGPTRRRSPRGWSAAASPRPPHPDD